LFIIESYKYVNEVITIARARKGLMFDEEIQSNFLNETITLKFYKPESFSNLYKYHICIVHDGNDYYQLGRLATLSDQLHEDGKITNTVFVGIHYIDRFDRRKKYHPDGELNDLYTKFLVHEVVPFLDESLPSYHMGQSRILMGDSLAGTLSFMTALKYPNTFGKVIMQSPLVNETVLRTVKHARSIDHIDVYHTIGTEETAVPTTTGTKEDFVTPNRKLNDVLKDIPMNYMYHELNGAKHTWKYWQQDLSRALTSILI